MNIVLKNKNRRQKEEEFHYEGITCKRKPKEKRMYLHGADGAVSFMDRLFFSTLNVDKTMKVGAAVVSCRRGGNTATFDALNKYFTMCGIPVASSQYWNMVYGGTPEEVLKDEEGMQTMRTLGHNMAFLMKSIQMGKEKLGIPQKEKTIFTNFHH